MTKEIGPLRQKHRKAGITIMALASVSALGISAFALIPTYAANNEDICVTATRVDNSKIVAKSGFCESDVAEPSPQPSNSSNPTAVPTATPTASPTPTTEPTITPAPTVTPPPPPPVNNFATVTISKIAATVSLASIAVSPDGTKMLAGSRTGYLHTSTDSGKVFTLRNIPGSWPRAKVAISADGKTLLSSATDNLNRQAKIWVSNDSGNTWIANTPMGSWGPVDMTPDASMMVVANDYGYGYYYSTDKGVTWKNKYIPKPAGDTTNRYIRGISLSNDGKTILVGDTLNVYLSKDGGATWVNQPSLKGSWRGVSVSGDGNTLIVSTSSGTNAVMISTDNGANWRNVDQLTGGGWGDISMSDDGTKIIASKLRGSLFTSIDSGLNWVEHSSASTGDWYDVDMLPDGSKFYAADNATGKTTVGTFGP